MSWLERIQTSFIIITGDGKQFTPNWLNASKTVDYNIAEFEFPNISGTLVNRGTPKGTRYNLEVIFQGEDHLDDALDFELSSRDPRPWTVTHPFYGRIIVQPVSLQFDNTQYNLSKVTGTIIETLTEDFPKTDIVPADKIAEDAEAANTLLAGSYDNDIIPVSEDINQMRANNDFFHTEGAKIVDGNFAEEYFNAFNTADAAITEATGDPLAAINAMQAVINKPALFTASVQARMLLLSTQMDRLRLSVTTAITKNKKALYQNNAGSLITTMCVTASLPQSGNYGNRTDVLAVIENIIEYYDYYIADLDDLQSDNGGNPDSFIPDVNSIIAINDLVNFTVSSLFAIALNARQERIHITEYDTNLIMLAHRFYGLLPDDSTLDELIRNNNIGLHQILQIPKNREIIYYV